MPGIRNNHPQVALAMLTLLLDKNLEDDFDDEVTRQKVINIKGGLLAKFNTFSDEIVKAYGDLIPLL